MSIGRAEPIAEVLAHDGVVALCSACAAEKSRVFGGCGRCGHSPRSDDELLDALLLSRYACSAALLARAAAERSPAVAIKQVDRATMRDVAHVVRDPQFRQLLDLAPLEHAGDDREAPVQGLHAVLDAARAAVGAPAPGLAACLERGAADADPYTRCEQLLQALHADAGGSPLSLLLEAVLAIGECCAGVDERGWQAHLQALGVPPEASHSAQRRRLWRDYERATAERLAQALEAVSTHTLVELMTRLASAGQRRRDKRALPLHRRLLDLYKQHAIPTLRHETDSVRRLASALQTGSAAEHALSRALVDELELLIQNWRFVAGPLGGVVADRDVASLSRELQGELHDAAEYLGDNGEAALSARAARLALELL